MYKEDEKIIARNKSLEYAIKTLTKNRKKSTVARKSYVRDMKNHLISNGSDYDKKIASCLTEKERNNWESFYESIIGKKKPRDLRVAYLSGPNPENDIEILVSKGILPENIWAFESDTKTYTKAIISALDSKFPFVKIYKGKIENYLKILPFKFDIIYLDFCKTIASTKTITVVKEVFLQQKLNSPGVLITNFSLPKESTDNKEYRENLNLLSANYLYPKRFNENYTELGGGFNDSAECCGISPEDFIEIAQKNEKTFYSQMITRLLYDLPSVVIPYQRLYSNPELNKIFFKEFDRKSFDENYAENLICFPNDNSLTWGLSNFFIDKSSFSKFQNKFNSQLSISSNSTKLIDSIETSRYFLSEGLDKNFHSDTLKKIKENWDITDKHLFCDLFLFHQLKEILVGQLTSPYYYNVKKTKRWLYKAKEADMFMDLITYDECRYIFDWMPTLDMFEDGVEDINRQLSLRFAMDSISKQSMWYNDEFFYGTAVVDRGTKTFKSKELKKRKRITKNCGKKQVKIT